MREADVEKYLKREVEKMNGMCWKFVSPGNNGVPDRILLFPEGKIIFAELKNGNQGRLSALQKRMQTVLKKFGFRTYVLKTKEEVDELIAELREEL